MNIFLKTRASFRSLPLSILGSILLFLWLTFGEISIILSSIYRWSLTFSSSDLISATPHDGTWMLGFAFVFYSFIALIFVLLLRWLANMSSKSTRIVFISFLSAFFLPCFLSFSSLFSNILVYTIVRGITFDRVFGIFISFFFLLVGCTIFYFLISSSFKKSRHPM